MPVSNLFKDFDFQILESGELKEDAVREELINPILKELGYKAYGHNRIVYSKALGHPFVMIGSQKREVKIIPDYLFEINGKYAWVLDAKAPNENILAGDNIFQAYSYAIHPDIDVDIFALCNGKEFVAYLRESRKPLLYFQLSEIEKHWDEIEKLLSPDKFTENQILKSSEQSYETKDIFSYKDLKLPKTITVKKQATKRHFGVHGYFTRQSWDILQHYIKHFTNRNDTVLDPFGGTGVTAIEALMLSRKAIHIDLNPLSPFIVKSLITPVDFDVLQKEFEKLEKQFKKNCPKNKKEILETKRKYPYPKQPICMKGADVEKVEDLFSDKQIAQLALLKHLIGRIKNEAVRNAFLLTFSSTITVSNLTAHAGKTGGPNSGAFAYYRYRIAKEPVELNIIESFKNKYIRVLNAKKEIASIINGQAFKNAKILKGTATNLSQIEDESIDYIYTDPPYGSKIPYLDLSVMWNAWLDLDVSDEDRSLEAIEGGRFQKTRDEYADLLAQSLKEMYRVLKFDRWMSFVFSHKDPQYWHIIVETAQKIGFEYRGAVKQDNGQSSFKKRQNPFSVLTGQLIINFIKKKTPKMIEKFKLGVDIYDLVIEIIESVIAENDGATLEEINNEMIIKGFEFYILDILSDQYPDLTPLLINEFDYDKETKCFHIRNQQKFRSKIPLDLRIKYFLFSYMKRNEFQDINPTTDDIILDLMPKLKNGLTPENQTILKILKEIAVEVGNNRWKLKKTGQMTLDQV